MCVGDGGPFKFCNHLAEEERKLADLLYLYICCHIVLWVGLCSVIMAFSGDM